MFGLYSSSSFPSLEARSRFDLSEIQGNGFFDTVYKSTKSNGKFDVVPFADSEIPFVCHVFDEEH